MTVRPHDWWDCRPLLITPESVTPDDDRDALGLGLIDRVWAGLTDIERHHFHQFTCDQNTSPAVLASVETIRVRYEAMKGS